MASGPPEFGMAYFPATARAEELIALAWYLEDGSRAFYAAVGARAQDQDSATLYDQLTRAEESHMGVLQGLYRQIAGAGAVSAFPQAIVPQERPGALMEGGVEVAQALEWSREKPPADLVEFCVALETNSYDLYLKMATAIAGHASGGVFDRLAEEERRHLEKLTARFEQLASEDGGFGGDHTR